MNHPTPAAALARRPFPSELADALAVGGAILRHRARQAPGEGINRHV